MEPSAKAPKVVDFKSTGFYTIGQFRGVYMVELDRTCSRNFKHILNGVVRVDGDEVKVLEVKFYQHPMPVRKGEIIGLLVNYGDPIYYGED